VNGGDEPPCRPDLFALLLCSGVFRRYVERFLNPEQVDAVEIER
jgi:hypothetical protein